MKKALVFNVFALVLLVSAFTVNAAEVLAPSSKDDPNLTIGAAEQHKNPYIVGGNVTINGKTSGDLVTAGGMVNVTGDVEQDAIVAGGSLNLSGNIGGDARIAGGNITITSAIGGDLVIAGGNVSLSQNSSGASFVEGDLLAATGNFSVNTPIKGSVRIIGGNITINSKIDGEVNIRSTGRLTFGPQAEVSGKIKYTGPKPAEVTSGAKVGNIEFTQYKGRNFGGHLKAFLTLAFLVKLLAWMLVGFLIVKFKKQFLSQISQEVHQKPWANLGIGLLWFIAMPIATALLFISLVGYYLAFLVGISFALMAVLSCVLSSLVLGYFIVNKLGKPTDKYYDAEAIIIGVVIWSVLRFIPIVGWVVLAAVFLMTFGAVGQYVKGKMMVTKDN